ncbi:VOC family protein [Aliiroseovarius sediminis]|uniref:VOC family protein n=1 Tax=Aliiroseovarius sediminis TaxID=2925839 RepID=UPI001F572844|nr:VOC family protein [Aliiroseovarius sediminis]MCI2394284.1 glyoxalase [Aliiroseovarius sediminis]
MLTTLHHVQLAMPEGQENRARAFYVDLLGLDEEPKPPPLDGRGGVWFRRGDLRVHLGVEVPFVPARKAHPAFTCTDLDTLAQKLDQAACPVIWDDNLIGFRRFYSADPFGNRIEVLQPA